MLMIVFVISCIYLSDAMFESYVVLLYILFLDVSLCKEKGKNGTCSVPIQMCNNMTAFVNS